MSASDSTVVPTPTSQLADGASTIDIAVTVVDTAGHPISGAAVTLAATGANNTLVQPPPTDASGLATGSLSSTTAEEKTITATVNGTQLAGQPVVTFRAGTPSASASTVQVSPSSLVADGAQAATVTVVAKDAFGNPVPGQAVVLAATGGQNTLVQPSSPTDASGTAQGSLASTLAESKSVTATVGGAAIDGSASVSFVPGAPSVTESQVWLSPSSAIADGSSAVGVSVKVRDAYDNPIAGAAVTLSATGSGNVITQPPDSGADGVASGSITSTVAGTKQVTASVAGLGVLAQQPTATFTPLPYNGYSSAGANPTYGITADGVASSTVTVVLRDVNDLPLVGYPVVLSASGSGNVYVQPPPTDSTGTTQGTVASTVAEWKDVYATVPGSVLYAGNVGFVPGPAYQLMFVNQPGTTIIGSPFSPPVEVEVADAQGNLVDTVNSGGASLSVASPDGGTIYNNSAAFSSGIATFFSTFQSAGTYTVVASSSGLVSVTSDPFAVIPAWNHAGFNGGAVSLLAVDPGDPSKLYAATPDGALFRSSNGGSTWTLAASGTAPIEALAVAPGSPSRVYYSSNKLYVSTDDGATWTAESWSSGTITALATDPNNSSTLFVGVAGGIYRSTDSGGTFTLESTVGNAGDPVNQIVVDPRTSSYVYAAVGNGLWFSSNGGGIGWSNIYATSTTQVVSVAVSGAGDVAAALQYNASNQWGDVYLGGNGVWPVDTTHLPNQVNAVAYDASGTLYVGTSIGVYQQTGSSTFAAVGLPLNVNFLLGVGGTVWAATHPSGPSYASGVYWTEDGGSWSAGDDGLDAQEITTLAVDPSNSGDVFAGTAEAGLFRTLDGGGSWSPVAEVPESDVKTVLFDPATPSNIYALTGGGMYASVNGGGSWALVSSPGGDAAAIDPLTPSTLYVTSNSSTTGLQKSVDSAASWSPASTGLPGGATHLVIDPTTPSNLYLSSSGSWCSSPDGGGFWSCATSSFAPLLVDQASDVFSSKGTGVYEQQPGGSATAVTGVINSITAMIETPTGDIYAAGGSYGSSGGYLVPGTEKMAWGGFEFDSAASGLPSVVVSTLAPDPQAGDTVYAGLSGLGVYKTTVGGR